MNIFIRANGALVDYKEDLVADSLMALLEATKNYDESKSSFQTHAYTVILNTLRDTAREYLGRGVLDPRHKNWPAHRTVGLDELSEGLTERTPEDEYLDADLVARARKELGRVSKEVASQGRQGKRNVAMYIDYTCYGYTLKQLGKKHKVSTVRAQQIVDDVRLRMKAWGVRVEPW